MQLIALPGLSKTVGVEELNARDVRVPVARGELKPTQMAVPSQDLLRGAEVVPRVESPHKGRCDFERCCAFGAVHSST
jgi:hypothetical protein